MFIAIYFAIKILYLIKEKIKKKDFFFLFGLSIKNLAILSGHKTKFCWDDTQFASASDYSFFNMWNKRIRQYVNGEEVAYK